VTLLLSPVTIRLPTTSPPTLTLRSPVARDTPIADHDLLPDHRAVAGHDHTAHVAAHGHGPLAGRDHARGDRVPDDRCQRVDQRRVVAQELLELELERG